MKIEDAKSRVLERISLSAGFAISEKELSPNARRSVTSLATMLRQLVIMKELLLLEQTRYNSVGSKIARAVSQNTSKDLTKNIAQVEKLQNDLSSRIEEAAKSISQELQSNWEFKRNPDAERTSISHVMIEQLKCKSCGAALKIPSSRIVKCDYCGESYAIADYLDELGASINPS